MSDLKSYEGGCHCGQVRYEVKLDLSQPAVTCNCSICQKTGSMLSFTPIAQFTLRSGEAALTDYQFNKKVIHHVFCSKCGVRSFARGVGPDGSEMAAINVRCLDGVDLGDVKTMQFDGKNR
ncbi:GFA family protein [Myxococcus sp. CA051A]|uniref:GFA family protein n=1 Tax=unclassified Myxococcus TaxID=2648731 RepID=UPI00157B111A|nr:MULTISPECIES: GFA family protein [unclassified Myxococcus]NTX15849.1 GFA family protein [Myxococcus sp. CA056]NTX33961.1 GFA family protein [Myxococcus sp. CA033]NTX56296.1 GFA family protein [Myxococcus sp. CA039A]NTX65282.1 GFA family protein [Myxococcus sp. CA051A]